MRECIFSTLVLLCCLPARGQAVPAGWKVITDNKATCRIVVPAEWSALGETSGAAVFHDSTTAIAVVTSRPGQEFKPLSAAQLKNFGIPKEKMFENSTARIFFQDKTSRNPNDTSAFSASLPAKSGTCSCRVVVLPSIPADVAKKIALSLSPVPAT